MSDSPLSPPSQWLLDHMDPLREASRLGPVLDLACGRGRHALHLARHGIPCLGIDRNRDHLRELQVWARREALPVEGLRADLETGRGIPIRAGSCGAILVFRFLFRPLFPAIAAALRPGGLLLYETFAAAHRATGRGPRRAAFYLEPNELRNGFPELEPLTYVEGPTGAEPPDITARLLARKPLAP